MQHLCVAVILYKESPHIFDVLEALRTQDLQEGTNISLVLVDNGISETLRAELLEKFGGSILLLKNRENFGFAGAVNQCVAEAQNYSADFLLLLNPDVRLSPHAVAEFLQCARRHPQAAFITPKLLRADQQLQPLQPPVIDACGMKMTNSLRHLDRGSEQLDKGQFETEEVVFGGTGACLLMRLTLMPRLFLPRTRYDGFLWAIYPQLKPDAKDRPQLMDEGFFAYREDADLSWRAQIQGLETVYSPAILAYHIRNVTPERRQELDPLINRLGVRNRFLLQFNNYSILHLPRTIIPGFFLRNLLVIMAVLFKEWRSLPGLIQALALCPRALVQRKAIFKDVPRERYRHLRHWFVPTV